MAHDFWTGLYAKPGRTPETVLAKVLRLVQGNSHMLSAIFALVAAQVPSEIECPDCGATIRAPYADAVRSDPDE